MAFTTINSTQTDAKSPIDTALMDTGLRLNMDDHETRILALEASSGGSGTLAKIPELAILNSGGQTNEGKYWRRRFYINDSGHEDSDQLDDFDLTGEKSEKRFVFQELQNNVLTVSTDSQYYEGTALSVAKDGELSFKIKAGENFFGIGTGSSSTSGSDSISVFIDGTAVNSYGGITDETGTAATATYSTNTSSTLYQGVSWYYGLDGKEHTVTVKNTDSVSKAWIFNFIEVGYRTEHPALEHDVTVQKGTATARGTNVTFSKSTLSFSAPATGKANGYTGAIVCDTAGTLTALDGESPAMTQVKANEAIAFSGSVTTLPVKNNWYFPSSGIGLMSMPNGSHHIFSWDSKTTTTVQTHSLDGVVWSTKPVEDFTPLSGFTTGTAGAAFGDLNINYIGTAPIIISSSNNKIDFAVTVNGTRTVHAATLANGGYSADLMPLEKAINDAMQTAKSINGHYVAEYNPESQLWTIGVESPEVSKIEFLFSSGANVANSIHTTIGFPGTDTDSDTLYRATTVKQHLTCRVFEKDNTFMHANDPRIKYSWAGNSGVGSAGEYNELVKKFGDIRSLSATAGAFMQIYPDDDCCGISCTFMMANRASMLTVQIDSGNLMYLLQADAHHQDDGALARGREGTFFISFPKGTRSISIRNEVSTGFDIGSSSESVFFCGARQFFTKPAFEKLTLSQSVLKAFEIAPISLYKTDYAHNSGTLYSPTATDNVNTVSETGSWSGVNLTNSFNQWSRSTATNNDYVDIAFVLTGDGGGFSISKTIDTASPQEVNMYLSTAAINESTDLIQSVHLDWGQSYYDQETSKILGLPAGTYNVRIKKTGSGTLYTQKFSIYDTVAPEENKNTVSDVTGTGQSVTYPVNVYRDVIQVNSYDRVPSWLKSSGYKDGVVKTVDYSANMASEDNSDDATGVLTKADAYYANRLQGGSTNAFFRTSGFFKSVTMIEACFNTYTTVNQAYIDGTSAANNHSQRVQVKGGSAPSTTRQSAGRLFCKQFEHSCSFSSGDTFTITDTRGFKNDMQIILYDGTNTELAVVTSFVTDTSFTVKQARATVTDGSVTDVYFYGFHSVYIEAGDTAAFSFYAAEYEPLPVQPSKYIDRVFADKKLETKSVFFEGVATGDDLYYPVHSDGVAGTWATSSISVVGYSSGSATYDIAQDLKNITVSAGALDIKVTSTRWVPKEL